MSNIVNLKEYKVDYDIKKFNKMLNDIKKKRDNDNREKIRAICETTLAALDKGLPTKNVITTFEMCTRLYLPKLIT
jgi:ribosomal protein S25